MEEAQPITHFKPLSCQSYGERDKILYINSPALTDAGVAELVNFPGLQHVSLDCDNLTEAALPALFAIRNKVRIQSSRISDQRLNNFYRGILPPAAPSHDMP